MKIDSSKVYSIPLISGPIFEKDKPIPYPDVRGLVVQYETTKEAIAALLPDCYQPGAEPLVTVLFGYNNGLSFLAGGEYRIATVQVAARFDGEEDHVEGDFILIMFENRTLPIIGGREHLGVPKLFSDISAIKQLPDGRLRCDASLWGHLLFSIETVGLKKKNALIRMFANRQFSERPWLGYKFIDRLDGPPDVDYPTITRNDVEVDELWLGKSAKISFGTASEEDISHVARVVEALKTLPIVRVNRTILYRGSALLRYDQSRQLR
ncbi:MAG: acetoacetate decarboxylase family protein [Candidatus Promineifilaceae bacterium]|jgi:acetoacetate decarboxylase